MNRLSRRSLLGVLAAATLPLCARAGPKMLRIGVQKYGTLVIMRERRTLEAALGPIGWNVSWHEFTAGPQLLEALGAGALDFGTTGEAPPVFAQAAGAPLLYVAFEPPSPQGEAILVPKDSPIRSIAELKGKQVALNKGSNVHFLLVQALARAGLKPTDITPVYLAPSDGRAAFERGAIDAWVIWDPFLAAAEEATGARVLTDGTGLAPNRQFFLATRDFAREQSDLLQRLIAEIDATDRWAERNPEETARLLAASMGLPQPVVSRAIGRMGYGAQPLTREVIADQQRIADTFRSLRLIPQSIDVSEAVWIPKS
ncbi:MAG: sulfonate ABC transporter substrate-binding protein [Acetobacteraceae bacterium]|nr:sulfonate ABC transporter substrate-binding protein [Acetobacteraceae bacterium]